MKKSAPLLLAIFLIIIVSCKKEQLPYNPVPQVAVNLQINLDNPLYTNLSTAGGYVYLDGGARGIVVIHNYDENYYALDRACPYHPSDSCGQINMQHGNIYLACGHYQGNDWIDCCGSQFMLDGSIVKGKSEYPLRMYRVQQSGTLLNITN